MKRTSIIFALVTSVTLSACQKDNIINPVPTESSESAVSQPVPQGIVPTTSTRQLIKHGNIALVYDGNGILQKAYNTVVSHETSYTYSTANSGKQWLTVTTHNGQEVARVNYSLNGQGRCQQIEVAIPFVPQGQTQPVYQVRTYKTQYNKLGRLVKIYLDTMPSVGFQFYYDANMNLQSINRTGQTGVVDQTITYSYTQPYGGAPEADLYPINPNLYDLIMDRYLNIFGTFSSYLVRSQKVVRNNVTTIDEYFKYNLDTGGYVMARERYDGSTNAYLETSTFAYKILSTGTEQ